jgi:hypothetical protein
MVMRNEFDQLLVSKAREAGATVMDGVPAIQLDMSPAGIRVVTPEGSFDSRVVAGADGAEAGLGATDRGGVLRAGHDLGVDLDVRGHIAEVGGGVGEGAGGGRGVI